MQEVDLLLDDNPSLSWQMTELDILNVQAQRELQSYNDRCTFVGRHPIVQQFLLRRVTNDDLRRLRRENPEKFLRDIANLQQNIIRIESNIRCKKYKNSDELKAWEENLSRAKIRTEVILQILRE